jgi:hypothetical protein
LINVFTFFMCLSGIYMMKEIAYITRKRWYQHSYTMILQKNPWLYIHTVMD